MQTKDWALRHRILGIPDTKSMANHDEDVFHGKDFRLHWFGGTEPFTNLAVGAMQTLVELGFLNPESETNGSPTAQEFLDFMKKYPMFTAIGYAVHPARRDARITIEGIEASAALDGPAVAAFTEFSQEADEITIGSGYFRCWWD